MQSAINLLKSSTIQTRALANIDQNNVESVQYDYICRGVWVIHGNTIAVSLLTCAVAYLFLWIDHFFQHLNKFLILNQKRSLIFAHKQISTGFEIQKTWDIHHDWWFYPYVSSSCIASPGPIPSLPNIREDFQLWRQFQHLCEFRARGLGANAHEANRGHVDTLRLQKHGGKVVQGGRVINPKSLLTLLKMDQRWMSFLLRGE